MIDLTRRNRILESQNKSLERRDKDLELRYGDLESQYKKTRREMEDLTRRNRTLESQNKSLERRIESLERQAEIPLTIMPPPSYREIVHRSTDFVSAQNRADHLTNDLTDNLNHFFQQAGNWANSYAKSPVPAGLINVIRKFKERQMNVAVSSQLLQDPRTYRHVITKLIIFSTINATFESSCFEQFNPDCKEQLRAEHHKRKVYGGIPSEERKALAEARTHTMKMFVHDPKWDEFLNDFVSNKCGTLWQMLQPVFGPGAASGDAWQSFVRLFRQAVSIALTMHQRVSFFRVDFPPVGEGSCFNPGEMVSLAAMGIEGGSAAGAGPQRLRLAITPVIFETVWGVNGAMGEPKPVCKACVLLE